MGYIWAIVLMGGPFLLMLKLVNGWKKNRDAAPWQTSVSEQ